MQKSFRILALTDFSEAAWNAACYAAQLSKKLQPATIVLYHVNPQIPATLYVPETVTQQLHTEIMEEANTRLLDWQQHLQPLLPSGTTSEILLEPYNLADTINITCEKYDIDLVVMGVTGKTEFEKILIGSNAIRLLEVSKYPLVIVPRQTEHAAPAKVLLTTDLSDAAKKAASPALTNILTRLQSELLVANVSENNEFAPDTLTEVNAVKEVLAAFNPEFHFLEAQNIGNTIHNFAVDSGAGLIITLRKRRNFFQALFHKSVSRHLVWHAHVPVMIIPE